MRDCRFQVSIVVGELLNVNRFYRASQPSIRWDTNGEVVNPSPENDEIDPELLSYFKDEQTFEERVKPLLDLSFVRKVHKDTTHFYEMPQPIQTFIQERVLREPLSWIRQAINIVSHALPEDENLEANFESLRGELTSHVLRCIEHSKTFDAEDLHTVNPRLITMLLTTLIRDGLEFDYIDKLIEESGNGYPRCNTAKWKGYQ
jgi:hypothetical protein